MRLPEGAANPFRSVSSAFGSAAVSRRGRQPGGWRCECCRGVGSRGVWAVEARELCVQEPVVVCFVVICCSCSRDSAVRHLSVIPVAPPVGVAWFRGPWVAAWRLVSVRSGRGGGPGGWRSGWLRGQPGPAFRASGPGGLAAVRRGIPPLQSHPAAGAWLSLAEHLVRDQGVAGSNPAAPTRPVLTGRVPGPEAATASGLFGRTLFRSFPTRDRAPSFRHSTMDQNVYIPRFPRGPSGPCGCPFSCSCFLTFRNRV